MRRTPTFLVAILTAAAMCIVVSCSRSPTTAEAHAEHPAEVTNPPEESELSTVTLTEDAIRRLGIETVHAARKAIRRTRTIGGELVVPPGRSVSVTAPVAGTLTLPDGGRLPAAGVALRRGQELLRLVPIGPAGNDLLQRETEANARHEAAVAAERRAEQLLRDRAGSRKQLEAARAELAVAESVLRAVRSQREALGGASDGDDSGAWKLATPLAGRLNAIHVAAGQTVASGTPLFDVVAVDTLWLRVPVYVGDLPLIDRTETAIVQPLAGGGGWAGASSAPTRVATPLESPPSANAAAATVDLFFRVDNSDGEYTPGQRVAVTLALNSIGERADRLVVPYSAVLYDMHGGTWVYENPTPREFVRRRVEVGRVVGDEAVLSRGLAPGAMIVAVGSAELFGTEFGVGH